MSTTKKDPVLVILQLTGGNDYLNTVIPYNDPLYRDNRPAVGVAEDRILTLNDRVGLHPTMQPIKNMYDQGKLAILHGVGYANSPRSHFRSMDIWHTCEPDKLGTEGWLGRAAKEIDPHKENVVTAVSFGPSLPRALALPGVPVACVDDLDSFGLLTGINEVEQRNKILDRFTRLYSPTIGVGAVMDYLGQTGLDSMKAADILKAAPEQYSSGVEYPTTAPAPTTARAGSLSSPESRLRAASTASILPSDPNTWSRATWSPAWTSAAFIPLSWKTGWVWMPNRWSAAYSRSPGLSRPERSGSRNTASRVNSSR